MESALDPRAHACLLASTANGVRSLAKPGLRMDDKAVSVAADLCLGAHLCRPTHATTGRQSRQPCNTCSWLSCHIRVKCATINWHLAMNNILGLHRALAAAKISSIQTGSKPSGLCLYPSNGKRPDGITVVPWKIGKLLVWEATCPNTFCPFLLFRFHQGGWSCGNFG